MKIDAPADKRESFNSSLKEKTKPASNEESKQLTGIMKIDRVSNEARAEKKVQFDLSAPEVSQLNDQEVAKKKKHRSKGKSKNKRSEMM